MVREPTPIIMGSLLDGLAQTTASTTPLLPTILCPYSHAEATRPVHLIDGALLINASPTIMIIPVIFHVPERCSSYAQAPSDEIGHVSGAAIGRGCSGRCRMRQLLCPGWMAGALAQKIPDRLKKRIEVCACTCVRACVVACMLACVLACVVYVWRICMHRRERRRSLRRNRIASLYATQHMHMCMHARGAHTHMHACARVHAYMCTRARTCTHMVAGGRGTREARGREASADSRGREAACSTAVQTCACMHALTCAFMHAHA